MAIIKQRPPSSYCTGDPSKRMWGAFGYIGFFTLVGASIRLGLNLLAKK